MDEKGEMEKKKNGNYRNVWPLLFVFSIEYK